MTPQQRYFFDLTGYLHLEGVLQGEELKAAQDATQRYIDTPPDQVPAGLEINRFGVPHPLDLIEWDTTNCATFLVRRARPDGCRAREASAEGRTVARLPHQQARRSPNHGRTATGGRRIGSRGSPGRAQCWSAVRSSSLPRPCEAPYSRGNPTPWRAANRPCGIFGGHEA